MKYKVNKGFVTKVLNGRLSIFDSEKSVLYRFNESATFIFEKIKAGLDKSLITEGLVKKYDVKKEDVTKDVDTLIKDLISKQIVKK